MGAAPTDSSSPLSAAPEGADTFMDTRFLTNETKKKKKKKAI